MSRVKRSFVGRADLVAMLAAWPDPSGDTVDRTLGSLTGFEVTERTEVEPRVEPPTSTDRLPSSIDADPPTKAPTLAIPFWQPRTYVRHDDPSPDSRVPATETTLTDARADTLERATMAAIPAPRAPLLSPHHRLVPMLEHALTVDRDGDELDVDGLVQSWSRGEHLTALPCHRLRGWPAIVVLLDRDFGLVPFWHDQQALLEQLRRRVGTSGLVVRFVDQSGPETGMLDEDLCPVSPYEGALAGLPVLALTDLGWYRNARHRAAWLRVGRHLRQTGKRIHALVPVPPTRWTRALARTWAPLAWELPALEDRAPLDPKLRARRASRLLDLAACAHRLEPGLLRTLRQLLPRGEANVGTEADAWLHRDMASPFPTATVVRDEHAQARRARATREDGALVAELQRALKNWHWHRGQGPELWHAEALALEHTRPGVLESTMRQRAERFVERLGAQALQAMGRAEASAEQDQLRRWLDYIGSRSPPALWRSDSAGGRGLQLAWWATHDDDQPPPEADPRLRAAVRREVDGGLRRLSLKQVGRGLVWGEEVEGSPVATLEASRPSIYVVNGLGSRAVPRVDGSRFEATPDGGIELRSDRSTLRLEPLQRPSWATAMGRDRFGLWAELEIEKAVARLRWIAPGVFTMGSPSDENARSHDEGPRHKVTISHGFWIGETPVTQELWQKIVGINPSHFKTMDRPVENVSWLDCQTDFLDRLNQWIATDRGEVFRLPTEAEWEYCCRSGTESVTYAGPVEVLGKNNVAALDAIAWYGGNSGTDFDLNNGVDSSNWKEKQYEHRNAGTRRVRQKQPNLSGLYDMLGNVWEWCLDGKRHYSSERQIDPQGPVRDDVRVYGKNESNETEYGPLGVVYRVFRGGSWYRGAKDVRAASRGVGHPDHRSITRGLRLVRGQKISTDQGQED